ncbi:hypothetical protein SAMN05444921_118149 [Streptomyces wuyuanensis]|uniref:Uncharacterized protein n=1 Tax=Streptomyces wuyuanensis TaxID=1196353 RepID=A0A1G9YIU3_9ACTN|nr:hypothetical protein SAMN05444921_118149 [Streptomyces wuyuanensis]
MTTRGGEVVPRTVPPKAREATSESPVCHVRTSSAVADPAAQADLVAERRGS